MISPLRTLWLSTAAALVVALPGVTRADPIEPLTSGAYCRVKSPGQQMHFTTGIPVRVLADGIDPDGWQWLSTRMMAKEVSFFVDGTLVDTKQQQADQINYFETRIPSLSIGAHALTVQSLNYGDVVKDGIVTVQIMVDDLPTHASTLNLTADVVLSGADNLDWTDVTVVGNGHRVTAADGWTGSVAIHDAFVTGLGTYDASGIDVATNGGAVAIDGSIFDGTGIMKFQVNGSGAITVADNELRANNLVTYVASNPDATPVISFSGNTSGAKVFRGNRVAAGYLSINGMDDWLVGGDDDASSNVFIGPRCIVSATGTQGTVVRGNYMHHDYQGGWSQGFNLQLFNSDGALAEHNVIRDSSWPVQSFGGEFRYNLVVNSGHDWFRSAQNGASFHHNVIVHASGPDGSFNGGFLFYSGEQDISIYNNTFDGGGDVGQFYAPIVATNEGALLRSIRNNIVFGLSEIGASFSGAFFSHALDETTIATPRVSSADYNCFFNPLAPNSVPYAPNFVATAAGAHDVMADPSFATGSEVPYAMPEGDIWTRRFKVSQVLAHYRELYAPKAGSPVIDTGDPADGTGTDIGAIEADSGQARVEDRFGKFGTRTDTTPPTVTLTAPTGGATLSGTTTLEATASDDTGVAIVQFFADDLLLGEDDSEPYSLATALCSVSAGTHTLTAKAWDADGNSATSAPVSVTVEHADGGTCVDTPPVGSGGSGGNGGGGANAGGNGGTTSSGKDSGCGCRMVGDERSPAWLWGALGLGLLGLGRRRRVRAER